MTGDCGRAAWLEQACAYLRGDPVLARLTDARPDFDPAGVAGRLPSMELTGISPRPPENPPSCHRAGG